MNYLLQISLPCDLSPEKSKAENVFQAATSVSGKNWSAACGNMPCVWELPALLQVYSAGSGEDQERR